MNSVALVSYILMMRMDEPLLVVEAVHFLTTMIDCSEMVTCLEETQLDGEGGHVTAEAHNTLWLLIKAFSLNTNSEAAASACLSFLETCIQFEYPAASLVELGAIRFVTSSMSSHRESPSIQLAATDVLCGLADCAEHVDEMVSQDVIQGIISNLYMRADGTSSASAALQSARPSTPTNSTRGMSTASSVLFAASRVVSGADDADGDDADAAAARSASDGRSILSSLIASSLFLVTSICAVGKHVGAAKNAGILRAVLNGFSKHNQDAAVYRNFREVISALDIQEAEVTAAINTVSGLSAKLQGLASGGTNADAEAFRFVSEFISHLQSEGRTLPGPDSIEDGRSSPTSAANSSNMTMIAERILESMSLLEAVTVSPVFVCVIVAREGVPVLLRTLGVISCLRLAANGGGAGGSTAAALLAQYAGGGATAVASGAGAAGKTIPFAVADEVMSRACNTLAHIARVGYELEGGQVVHDHEYEDINYADYPIEEELYSSHGIGVICKAMQNGAKSNLRLFARDSTTLISWLASGQTTAQIREHVDVITAHSGIEACVSMLRAHQASVDICISVAGALSRIAGTAKGSVAVAQRGASRQVLRMLRPSAAIRSRKGDDLFLAFLQVLDNCASNGSEACELLRKQNVTDALCECIDAGNSSDFFKTMDEVSGSASAPGSKGASSASASAADAGAAAGAAGGDEDGNGYQRDPDTGSEIDATIASILSNLVGADSVKDTVGMLVAAARELASQTFGVGANAYSPKKPLRLPHYERSMIVRAVVRLGLLASTEAGAIVGNDVLEAGASACVDLAQSALVVSRALESSDTSTPNANSIEAELSYVLPAAIRSIKQVLSPLITGDASSAAGKTAAAGTTAAVQAVPMLIRTLEERTEYRTIALETLSVLSANEFAAAAVPSAAAGKGIAVVLEALRSSAEAGAEGAEADAATALARVARLPDCRPLCVLAGVPPAALSILTDTVTEASAEATAALLDLLAQLAAEPRVLPDLITSNIFDIIRTALQRHCTDAYEPQAKLLQACALLLTRLAVSTQVNAEPETNPLCDELRAMLIRVIKAAASSTGYLDVPECMVAVLELITASCTTGGFGTAANAAGNKAACVEAEAEDMIVLAMSSSAANDAVLSAGSKAMAAIGSANRAAKFLEEIDSYASSISEWLEAGWEGTAPEVIDLVTELTDRMRSLGSCVVVASSSASFAAPELGAPYSEVLNTIWRAVHAVCRDEMKSRRAGADAEGVSVGSAGKDLHQARADTLALGAQIAGRLVTVSTIAEASEGAEGEHVVPVPDAVAMLATVCFAARPAMEVRVIESMCRALEITLDHKGAVCLKECSGTGVTQSLSVILTAVRNELSKAKSAGAGGAAGLGSSDDDLLLPLDELRKAEGIVASMLKSMTSKARSILKEASASNAADSSMLLLNSSDDGSTTVDSIITELLQASALVSSSTITTEAAAADGASAAAVPAIEDDKSSELYTTVDAAVAGSLSIGGAASDAPYSVISALCSAVAGGLSGAAKWAPQGRAPLQAVVNLQIDARVSSAVVRSLSSRLASEARGAVAAGSTSKLTALLSLLTCATDMAHISGRQWRVAAKAYLSGQKPEKGDLELEASPEWSSAVDATVASDADAPTSKAIWSSAAAAATIALKPLLDLLSRMEASSAISLPAVDSVSAPLALLIQSSPPSDRSTAVSAIRALARLSDMMCADVMTPAKVPRPSDAVLAARTSRVLALGATGIYKAVLLACSAASNADNEEYCQEAIALVATVARYQGVINVQTQFHLEKACLTSLQASLRKYGGNTVLVAAGQSLVALLERFYAEQSGAAFEATSTKALKAMADVAKSAFQRNATEDGQLFYSKIDSEESQWDPPAAMNAAMAELLALDRMSRVLEDEAVTAVEPKVIQGMVAALEAHAHDPGIVGILIGAMGKLAANPDNHVHLEACGALDKIVANIKEYEHINDPRVCEALASLVLPLSFDPFLVKAMLGPSNVAPLLIQVANKYSNHLTTYIGSDMSWVPDNAPDYNKTLQSTTATGGQDAAEKNKQLPRVAQTCAQSIANLACDNEPAPETGKSTVDLLVEGGAIDVLGSLMRQHRDNPRLLEDSICGLSNMAFVSDNIQLSIGRTCMDSVCTAATQYNGDSYLFQMTLRAIGNLTRTDENIVRAVGYGAFRGMVEGMQKHKDSPEVLKLCADVIGNMASIDDRKLAREDGIGILKECLGKAVSIFASPSAAPPAVTAPPPPPSPARPGSIAPPPSTPAPPSAPVMSSSEVIALVESCDNIKYAVCSLLYQDGGAKALIDAMLQHPGRPELAASCLRALHYISSSAALMTKMVENLSLSEHVVYIMQANDTSSDVLRRGARILGGISGVEKLQHRVIDARAPPVLLTSIENQRGNREVCFLCYSVLTLLRGPAVTTAVREVRAVDTTMQLFRSCLAEGDVEFYAVLLELLLSLATEPDLAIQISQRGASSLVALLSALARSGAPVSPEMDQVTLFSYLLSTISALCKAGMDASDPLIAAGITGALVQSLQCVTSSKDPRVLLNRDARRAVLNSVAILADIVRIPVLPGDAPPPIPYNTEAADAVAAEGGAAALETVVTVYKAIPDVANPNSFLFDANTCKAATAVLHDLVTCGYTCGIQLEGSEQQQLALQQLQSETAAAPVRPTAMPAPAAPSAAPNSALAAAEPDIVALINPGRPHDGFHRRAATIWLADGKPTAAHVLLSADRASVEVDYQKSETDPKTKEIAIGRVSVPIKQVAGVRMGNPPTFKKKLFGRAPKADHSFYLEDASGACRVHLEFEAEGDRKTASVAVAALAGVSRKPAAEK